MLSAVIVGNGATKEQVSSLIQSCNLAGINDIIVVSPSRPETATGVHASFIASQPLTLASCMRQSALIARETELLVLDGRLSLSKDDLIGIIRSSGSMNDSNIAYVPVSAGGQLSQLTATAKSLLVRELTSRSQVPLAAVVITTSALKQIGDIAAENSGEIILQTIVTEIASGRAISTLATTITAESEVLTLSKSAQARVLRAAVQKINIEELFPTYSWKEKHGPSAAQAYEALAAAFIKCEDTTSALECLQIIQQFSDSPRATALKGLISIMRGETLGAVANMVASLQQYELQIANGSTATTRPANWEAVTESLKAGLEALHSKDNRKALTLFTDAVFSFDPFYAQSGLASIQKLAA